jgi:hypothetical protein
MWEKFVTEIFHLIFFATPFFKKKYKEKGQPFSFLSFYILFVNCPHLVFASHFSDGFLSTFDLQQ